MKQLFNHLQDYIAHAANNFPNHTAITVNKKQHTYREIDEDSNKLADALIKMNCVRGDRILLCLDNSFEAVILFWAALKADLIVTLINPQLSRQKIIYIANDLGAKYIFFDKKIDFLADLKSCSLFVAAVFVNSRCFDLDQVMDFKDLIESGRSRSLYYKNLDIDLACIIYTSGSTGMPKGVMLTHRNMLTASTSIQSYLKLNQDDVIISGLPMSFDYGLYQIILAAMCGAQLILERDFTWPNQFMEKMMSARATIFPAVPTMLSIIENHFSKNDFDLSSVRMVTNTGASLLKRHIAMVKYYFPSAKLFSMYGLTECKRCTYLPPELIDVKSDSVGIAIPNTEIWVVDDYGTRLLPRQVGQLVVRGGTVMRGYWNKPSESYAVLKPSILPDENILYTGDYGYLDEEGFFYLSGRKDEVIKCLGQKVSLRIVEDLICSMSMVNEVAVLAVPDEKKDFSLAVFVSGKDNSIICDQMILEQCKKNLEKTHWPDYIYLLPSLPKGINGKIDKLKLRQQLIS